jgi:DNA-binding transcriptional LysR family regulator
VLVTPAALQLRAPVTWAQLAALPYIQLDCPGALAVLALCRAAGFDAPLTRTLATDTSIAAMVRLGVGYSILPRLAVFPEPDGVRIVDLPISAPRRFALVVRPDTARDKVVQAVTRFIRNKRIVSRSDVFKAALVAW